MTKQKCGIYIHIPFCKRKCRYCDFISSACSINEYKDYQEALLKEIILTKIEYIPDSIFFGGGTPSIYPPNFILQILNAIKINVLENCGYEIDFMKNDLEVTIECNPGTISFDNLSMYKSYGINRLSIGLQSADNDELKLLGRVHTYDEFYKSYKNAVECGFNNINIDIMSAIPTQTIKSYKNTLDTVLSLNPSHISAYSLIIEENTPFFDIYSEGKKDSRLLPDEETEREMYYLTEEILSKSGYDRYEISNYSKKGFECRHNIKYWTRCNYYGFGVSAASMVDNKRYTNTHDRDIYVSNLKNDEIIRDEKLLLDVNQQMEEFMFLGLRMINGISVDNFNKTFGTCGKDFESVYGKVTSKLNSEGLCDISHGCVKLTKRGIDISNYVMSEYLLD